MTYADGGQCRLVGPEPGPPGPPDLADLYTEHWRGLVRLAMLLVDDVSSAEDVVQDAFIALHRKASALRDPDAALGYLRASVLNLARSVIRRRQVARKHLRVAEPDQVAGADQDVLLSDEHRRAYAAVHRLPQRQREVIVLRYWANLSEAEIAAAMGISRGTVKSNASRGLAALERMLHEDHS
jgi:RNA polymerase sigma-70 factor (sigma-E family)